MTTTSQSGQVRKGKLFSFLIIALGTLLFSTGLANAEGYIQVNTEEGVGIYLDENYIGAVGKEPFIIEAVAAGSHDVKLTKSGFESKSVKINVRDGDIEVIEHRSFSPAAKVTQEGERSQESSMAKTGSLRIRTVPIECRVTIDGLNLAKGDQLKKQSDWILNPVMANTYSITLDPTSSGRKVSFKAQVFEGEESQYLVNLINGKIIDQGAEKRAKKLEEQRLARAAELARQEEEKKRAAALARERQFKADYSSYLEAKKNSSLSHIQKAMMWKELCKKWDVDPGAGVRLEWTNHRVVVVR